MAASTPSAQLRGLYAITDDQLLARDCFLEKVEQALAGGVALLQYRSKQPDAAAKLARARSLNSLCQDYGIPLIINDDAELAAMAGAAGVHLGRNDGGLARARSLLGAQAIIGITCHGDLAAARRGQDEGADYVAFGRFFASMTKPGASAAAIEVLTAAKQQLNVPIVAIGGINADNGASLITAGADMLAVIHALFAEADVSANARRLTGLFD